MKFKEFLEEVKRTIPDLDKRHIINQYYLDRIELELEEDEKKPIAFPKDLVNQTHCRLGILSELNELQEALVKKDKVNVQEELCDLLWYVANDINTTIKRRINVTELTHWNPENRMQVSDGGWLISSLGVVGDFHCIVYNASKLANLNKRDLAYGKPEDFVEYIKTMIYLLGAVNNLALHTKTDLEDGMEKNIAKLRKRYPNKFSQEKALNRNLDAERKVLEGEARGAGDDYPVIDLTSQPQEGPSQPEVQ